MSHKHTRTPTHAHTNGQSWTVTCVWPQKLIYRQMHTNRPRGKALIFTTPTNVYSFHWISMTEPLPAEAHFLSQHIHLASTYKRYATEQMRLIWDVGIRQISTGVYLPLGEQCKQRKQCQEKKKFDKCAMGRKADKTEGCQLWLLFLFKQCGLGREGDMIGQHWTVTTWWQRTFYFYSTLKGNTNVKEMCL